MTASAERQPLPSGELLTACCSEWKDVKLLICLKDQNRCVSYSSGRDLALGINLSFFSFSLLVLWKFMPLGPTPHSHLKPDSQLPVSSTGANILRVCIHMPPWDRWQQPLPKLVLLGPRAIALTLAHTRITRRACWTQILELHSRVFHSVDLGCVPQISFSHKFPGAWCR